MIITANDGWYGFPLGFFQLSCLSVFLRYSIFQTSVSLKQMFSLHYKTVQNTGPKSSFFSKVCESFNTLSFYF